MSGELVDGKDSRLTLGGVVLIHGSEQPLEIAAQVRREGRSVQAEAEFVVPYVEWGMNDPSGVIVRVKKELQVRVEVHGELSP